MWSEFLQCWLRRVIDDSGRICVRLSLDEAGANLVLTADESTTLERERAEQERDERRAVEEKLAKLRAKLVAAGIDPDE